MATLCWVLTDNRTKLLESLKTIPEIGKKNKSELIELALSEFIERHSKTNNPQTTLDNTVKAVPHIYEILEHPEVFDKYYKLLNAKETNYLAKAINALTHKHKLAKRKFE